MQHNSFVVHVYIWKWGHSPLLLSGSSFWNWFHVLIQREGSLLSEELLDHLDMCSVFLMRLSPGLLLLVMLLLHFCLGNEQVLISPADELS